MEKMKRFGTSSQLKDKKEQEEKKLSDDKELIKELRNKISELEGKNHVLQEELNKAGAAEREKFKKDVKESETRYRAVLKAIPDFLFVVSSDGIFLDYHAKDELILAEKPEDFIGKSIFEILNEPLAKQTLECLEKAYKTKKTQLLEYDIEVMGQQRFYEARITCMGDERLLSISRDITDRKQWEKTLKENERLLDFVQRISKVGGWEWEIISQTMRWTDETYRIHELTPEDAPQGSAKLIEKSVSCYREEDRETILDAFRCCMEDGKPYDLELPFTNARGHEMWIRTTAEPVFENGKVVKVNGNIMDITGRKEAEKELKDLNNKLKELIITKDKLFSIIAHDLKSPFNSILGFTRILLDGLHEHDLEKTEYLLGLINSVSKQTYNLLENLLTWARAQTGNVEFDPEKLSVKPVILDIIEFFEPIGKVKNISLNYFQSDELVVYADRNMLQAILRNLISNAIKFTNTGGKVYIYVVETPGRAEITVQDTGIGMNKKSRDSLFSIESGHSSPGTQNEKGSGLGLILCKEFAEKHGSSIKVESEPGKGSRFTFTLPYPE
jgi:two-component system, sensor histidine kinase and response regulator